MEIGVSITLTERRSQLETGWEMSWEFLLLIPTFKWKKTLLQWPGRRGTRCYETNLLETGKGLQRTLIELKSVIINGMTVGNYY